MLRDKIISYLTANKQSLLLEFGVEQIGLFGSYARGEEDDNSDIDILVSLKLPKYSAIYKVQKLLEIKFNRKVEVIRKGNHLRESFLNTIEKEIIYA